MIASPQGPIDATAIAIPIALIARAIPPNATAIACNVDGSMSATHSAIVRITVNTGPPPSGASASATAANASATALIVSFNGGHTVRTKSTNRWNPGLSASDSPQSPN